MKIDNGFFLEDKGQPKVQIDYLKEAMAWAGNYANDVQLIEAMALNSEAYRICVLDMYRNFVSSGELVKLDNVSKDEKLTFWNESKRIFPDEMSDLKRKQLCIFLYFMSFIFEKYFIA